MKLAKHNNALETNTKTEGQNFGIGDASVVIEILRNRLYKHKVRTLVQEYISNGRDASREAGSKRNIKVVSPTVFDPTFKVRDYGPGISPDRIANVFVMYGSSTKRDSNNQTGGFGIGAKSAWSYTDSFTIITYIDGTKRTYIAHTGVNNNGRLDFLGETTTKEPNGTEIQIGVAPSDIKKFQTSILRAIHFWKEDVDLTGMDVSKEDLPRGFKLNNFEIVQSDTLDEYGFGGWYDKVALSIDGILYSVDQNIYNDVLETSIINGKLIVHIDTGLIDVSASREEITIGKENETKLHKIFRQINTDIDKYIQKEMRSVKTINGKIKKMAEINQHFNKSYNDGTYNIDARGTLSTDLFTDANLVSYTMRRGKLRKTYISDKDRSHTYRRSVIDLNNLYYFDNSESLVKRGHRVREFLKTNSKITVLELKGSVTSIYNRLKRDLPFKDLKTITYTEVPKTASVRVKRQNSEFCVHEIETLYLVVNKFHTTMATNKKIWYYVEMNGNAFPRDKAQLKDISLYLGIRVCGLSKSSVSKVKGDKNFKSLDKYLKGLKPTDNQIKQIQYNLSTNRKQFSKYINTETIDNKKLKSVGKFYKTFKGMCHKELPVILKDWEKNEKVLKFLKDDAEVKSILKPCKLLNTLRDAYGTIDKDEVTFYINCKLKETNNG